MNTDVKFMNGSFMGTECCVCFGSWKSPYCKTWNLLL